MKNKLLRTTLMAGIAASSLILSGCGEEPCQMEKPVVDMAAFQIIDLVAPLVAENKGAKTLRNTKGMEVLGFTDCTIPGNNDECKSIQQEGIMFTQGSTSYAARMNWAELNGMPGTLTLIVATKSTKCTYPLYHNGEANANPKNGSCVQNAGCTVESGLLGSLFGDLF